MNDTSPEILNKMNEMIQRVAPERRLLMGCSMFDFAKELARESILLEKGRISAASLRRELFLRFYADDFTPDLRRKILRHLQSLKGQ